MKYIILIIGLLFCNIHIQSQDLKSNLSKPGFYIAKNFSEPSLKPGEFLVNIPDTGKAECNSNLALGYTFSPNVIGDLLSDLKIIPYIQIAYSSKPEAKKEQIVLGSNILFRTEVCKFKNASNITSFNSFLDFGAVRDNLEKENSLSFTYTIMPNLNLGILGLTKTDLNIPFLLSSEGEPSDKEFFGFYNYSSFGINLKPNNSNPQFEKYTSLFVKFNPGLVFNFTESNNLTLDVNYLIGKKFGFDSQNLKYFNAFNLTAIFYVINNDKNKFGIGYEFFNGQNPILDTKNDHFQKVSLTARLFFKD